MTILTETDVISLELDCEHEACAAFASPLLSQLATGRYDRCSMLQIPDSSHDWREKHRTARKRAARCERNGYHFAMISGHEYADDIYTINTSAESRQGRRMTDGYRQRPSETPLPIYPCGRHGIHTYGVLHGHRLLAYLWMYRAGNLALVSQILGHADHLEQGIMYLLFAGALSCEIEHGPGVIVYNRHDSGTDGLRFFKERLGFQEKPVSWLP